MCRRQARSSAGKLYALIDGELYKWTVITSKQDLRDLAAKEQGIASRMIRDGNVDGGKD